LLAKLNKLRPTIQSLTATPSAPGQELLNRVASFDQQVAAQDVPGAQQTLREIGALLKKLMAGAAPSPPAAETEVDLFLKKWNAARSNLRAAIDRVEEQLIDLAEALLKSNDANLIWIAEEGLSELVGGLRASATTIDKSTSKTPAKVAERAQPALAELAKKLDTQQVKVCDQNQYGVNVSIKKTVRSALDELQSLLESATAR